MAERLDFESLQKEGRNFELNVVANEMPGFESTLMLPVEIVDIDDNPPTFRGEGKNEVVF